MQRGKRNKNRRRNNATKPAATDHTDAGGDTKAPNCHFVPRWILRNFVWQQEGSDDPTIYCFDVEEQALTRPLLRKAYEKKGLFQDPDNPPGRVTYKLEKELGQLEGRASRSFLEIKNALNNRDQNPWAGAAPTWPPVCVKQKRKHLHDLRKFMFVMYYHQVSVGETYYNEVHPDNANLRARIANYREKHGLSTSPEHIWLHVLQHYLQKEHDDLMKEGWQASSKAMEKIFSRVSPDLRGESVLHEYRAIAKYAEVEAELEEWKLLPYYNNMQMFLVIWEAAAGEEFLMSDKSFGLYEGRTEEAGPVHWIYVISPRIVLVLCHPGLRDNHPPPGFRCIFERFPLSAEQRSMSMLLNAPHPAASVKYRNLPLLPAVTTYGNDGDVPVDPDDEFELQISVLSPEDTHTINAIILGNVSDKGHVTFHSKDAALRTLDAFGRNMDFKRERKVKFASLAQKLSEDPHVRPNVHLNLELFKPEAAIPPFRLPPLSTEPGTFWETTLMVYHTLHRGQDPQCISYRSWERMHIEALTKPADTNLDLRQARLVSKMDDKVAYFLFRFFAEVMANLFGESPYLEVYTEPLIIAFLDFYLKNDRPFFDWVEEVVPICLHSDFGPSGCTLTANIKIYLSPEDDEGIPVPEGFSLHDSEAAAGSADTPPDQNTVYADWASARAQCIQDTMSPGGPDLPSWPFTKAREAESSDPELAENHPLDMRTRTDKRRVVDSEQEHRASIPSHPCVTTNGPLYMGEVSLEENQKPHPGVDLGIHSNTEEESKMSPERRPGVVDTGDDSSTEEESKMSPEQRPSVVDAEVRVNTVVGRVAVPEMLLDAKPRARTNMEADQGIAHAAGKPRARRDLGGEVCIAVRETPMTEKVFAIAFVVPVRYSAYLVVEVTSQIVEIVDTHFASFVELLERIDPPAFPPQQGGKTRGRHSSAPEEDSESYYSVLFDICIHLVTGLAVVLFFFSFTLTEFCTSIILNLLNDVDGHGDCSLYLAKLVSDSWEG